MHTYQGSCFCGNLELEYRVPAPLDEAPIRRCLCRFCCKHGAVYTSHPQATLRIKAADGEHVKMWRHGTETAEFLMCTGCGVIPAVLWQDGKALRSVFNIRVLDPYRGDLEIVDVQFDGETQEERLARRSKSWIGQTTVEGIS